MYVQVIGKNKKETPKINADSTLTPLNHALKIFGLYCITSDGGKLKYTWPILKIAIITIALFTINCICVYFAFGMSNRNNDRFRDCFVLIYILGYIQYVVDLTFMYKYGRQLCLNYYTIFKNIDKVIGMPYYDEMKRRVFKICIFFLLTGTSFFLSYYTAVLLDYGWFTSTLHSIDLIYTSIKMLTALDAIAHFTQVKYRLKRIEDILRDYYSTAASLPGVTKDVICKKDWDKNVKFPKRLHSLATVHCNRFSVISHLSRCYLLLLEQCDYINAMFGFRALFSGFVYLMEMVILSNFIIRLILGTLVPLYQSNTFPILSTTLKIVNYSLILLCKINCCEQIYKQTERIVRCIDHLLTNKKLEIEAHEALSELRELITTRPVSFTALNFYKLANPTVLSMTSAVVTYTIILLQNVN